MTERVPSFFGRMCCNKDIIVHKKQRLMFSNIWAASWQNQQTGMCIQRRLRWAWASAQADLSLCWTHIRPVWSESSLSARRKLGFLVSLWGHSDDWSDWADAQADLSLRWAHMPFCWFCHVTAHFSYMSSFDQRDSIVCDHEIVANLRLSIDVNINYVFENKLVLVLCDRSKCSYL